MTIGWGLFLVSVVIGYVIGAIQTNKTFQSNIDSDNVAQKYSNIADMIKDEHFRFVGVRNGSTHAMLMVNDISLYSMLLSKLKIQIKWQVFIE